MAKKVLIPVLSICIAGCVSERLQVTVTDSDGNPISNAVVHVGFSTSHVIFGGGHTSSKKGGHAEAKTDTNGIAVVWFNCTSSVFGWHVEADGYYRSESHRGHFKGEDVIIPPAFIACAINHHWLSSMIS